MGGFTVVVGGACVVVVGGGAVVVVGCVVVGCVVVVVVVGCVVVVVVSLLVVAVGEVVDGGGDTTVGLPSVPVTVTGSVSGAPGVSGFVVAGTVAVWVRVDRMGLDSLVSVHTKPPAKSSTAISEAANRT